MIFNSEEGPDINIKRVSEKITVVRPSSATETTPLSWSYEACAEL